MTAEMTLGNNKMNIHSFYYSFDILLFGYYCLTIIRRNKGIRIIRNRERREVECRNASINIFLLLIFSSTTAVFVVM